MAYALGKELTFRTDRPLEGRDLVLRYHYSGTFHPVFVLTGTAHISTGHCVAACCFRTPTAKWKHPVLELARLVRAEEVTVPLTWLISQTSKAIHAAGKYDLLVSYADQTHQHHGGIYQACSWFYHGATKSQNDGLIIDGKFIAGRACNNLYGTRSADKLSEKFPELKIEKHWDHGKHLYWRPLTKKGEQQALSLCLQKLPYPKPDGVA